MALTVETISLGRYPISYNKIQIRNTFYGFIPNPDENDSENWIQKLSIKGGKNFNNISLMKMGKSALSITSFTRLNTVEWLFDTGLLGRFVFLDVLASTGP